MEPFFRSDNSMSKAYNLLLIYSKQCRHIIANSNDPASKLSTIMLYVYIYVYIRSGLQATIHLASLAPAVAAAVSSLSIRACMELPATSSSRMAAMQ